MEDEPAAVAAAAIGTTATLTPLIVIRYGRFQLTPLTSAEVIHKINECVSLDQQINLIMDFHARDHFDVDDDANYERFRFDATADMQNAVIQYSRHIKEITIENYCSDKEEHDRCFTFCTKIVLGLIGKGKHLSYTSYVINFEIELQQANQLAQALLRSNNNNNGAIDSFLFYGFKLTPVTIQPLLDALLATSVRRLVFGNENDADPPIEYNNNNIDFTGMETNISLKELNLGGYNHMRIEDFWSLFHSIKKNQGLEKLKLDYTNYKYFPTRMKRLFKKMLSENITLLDCSFVFSEGADDPIFETIQFHTELNRMWKRYRMKRNEDSTAIIATTSAGAATTGTVLVASKLEANKKKKFKMRLLLSLFIQKREMRNTILFHLLREYPDDLGLLTTDDTHQQQHSPLLLLRLIHSNFVKNKRKRTTYDDDL